MYPLREQFPPREFQCAARLGLLAHSEDAHVATDKLGPTRDAVAYTTACRLQRRGEGPNDEDSCSQAQHVLGATSGDGRFGIGKPYQRTGDWTR
jgi:hypothetical protein